MQSKTLDHLEFPCLDRVTYMQRWGKLNSSCTQKRALSASSKISRQFPGFVLGSDRLYVFVVKWYTMGETQVYCNPNGSLFLSRQGCGALGARK